MTASRTHALSAVWPSSARRNDTGTLEIGGAPVTNLVAEFGTPLMVIDEHEFRNRASRMLAAAKDAFGDARVYYASKALLTADIARWVAEAGLGIDVCSLGELTLVQRVGIDPAIVGHHGNNKTVPELTAAIEWGIGTIVIDSAIEIERVAAIAAAAGRRQRVRLRINVGVHASTHEFLATSHEDQKFGVPLADAAALVAAIRSHDSLEFVGLHAHIGSQIFDAAGFAESATRLLALHKELSAIEAIRELNLGGGFGIAYLDSDDPEPIETIMSNLADAVRAACESLDIEVPSVAFEPGRWIAGPAGVTLYSVGTLKPVSLDDGQRLYVSVDGGMSDNARPALYGAEYTAQLANRASDTAAKRARVVGLHCESGDIVIDSVQLPGDITPGDVLAVPATGAYCASLASNYNMTPRPPIVAVRDAAARVLVRRETIDDLVARDAGLNQETR